MTFTRLRRIWKKSQDDDIFGQAAKLSYFSLLAIFPFLLFLTTLLGLLARTGTDLYDSILSYFRQVLPYEAFTLVIGTLDQVRSGAGGGKLTFGILLSLWAAASGMSELMNGLNRVYGVKEGRPWWKAKLTSLGLTLALSVFVIVATALVIAGSKIGDLLAGYFGLEAYFNWLWNLLQWPVALAFLGIAFGLLYRFAPSRKPCRWKGEVEGAVAGIGLWLAVSLLFRLYLHFFNSYNATYGSLGAVIVLLLWLNLSGVSVLMGAEVSADAANTTE